MFESKNSRFCRVAEARLNKIIKMVRLLGNCSNKIVYAYTEDQVEQIFETLQAELIRARRRYAQLGKKKFSLSMPVQSNCIHPSIELSLSDGTTLNATAFVNSEYPAISIYWGQKSDTNEETCFAEYNPEHNACRHLCIGAYQSHQNDTTYYEPYMAERKSK